MSRVLLPWGALIVGLVLAAVAFVVIRDSNLNTFETSVIQDCETQQHAIQSAFDNAFSYVGAAADLIASTNTDTRLTPQLMDRFTAGLRLNAQLQSWLMVLWLPYVANETRAEFETQMKYDLNDSNWQIVTWGRAPRPWDARAYLPFAFSSVTGPVPAYLYILEEVINGFDVGVPAAFYPQILDPDFPRLNASITIAADPNYHAIPDKALVSLQTAVFAALLKEKDLPSGFLGLLNHYLDMTTLAENALLNTGIDQSKLKIELWDPQSPPAVGQWLYNGSSISHLARERSVTRVVKTSTDRSYRIRCTPSDSYVMAETLTVPIVSICFIALVALMIFLLWRRYFVISDLLRQVAEVNRQKTQFLSFVCHELRNPLHAIIGMNSLLLETSLDGEQKGFSMSIDRSAQLMCAIVNDVLDMSKIEAGKLEFDNVPFSLRALAHDIEDVYRLIVEKKDLAWEVEVLENVPQVVMGDPVRIRQMLINFVSNAFKFTTRGQVKLTVSRARTEKNTVWITFQVSDTGAGIAAANVPKLFKAFSQTQGTAGESFSGTGLGLSIVKSLAETMGGHVSVSSELGVGSVFSFDLPLKWGDATAAPVTTATGGRGGGFRSNWKEEVYHSVAHHWDENDAVADEREAGYTQGPAPPLGHSQGREAKEVRLNVVPLVPLRPLGGTSDPVLSVDEEGLIVVGGPGSERKLRGGKSRVGEDPEQKPLMADGELSPLPSLGRAGPGRSSIELQEVEGKRRDRVADKEDDERRASPPSSAKGPSARKAASRSNSAGSGNGQPAFYAADAINGNGTASGKVLRAAVPALPSPAPASSQYAYPPLRILLVDDGAVNRKLVAHILNKPGIMLVTAVDGLDGLEAVERAAEPFDMIFMDVHMPRLDGLGATRRLRAMGLTIPIIALTANAMSSDRITCLEAGMSDVLTKPFTGEELTACVLRFAIFDPSAPAPTATTGTAGDDKKAKDKKDKKKKGAGANNSFESPVPTLTVDVQVLGQGQQQGQRTLDSLAETNSALADKIKRADYWSQVWKEHKTKKRGKSPVNRAAERTAASTSSLLGLGVPTGYASGSVSTTVTGSSGSVSGTGAGTQSLSHSHTSLPAAIPEDSDMSPGAGGVLPPLPAVVSTDTFSPGVLHRVDSRSDA